MGKGVIYIVKYKETFCGSQYGEYEMVVLNSGYEKRLLASFGQSWDDEDGREYGGLGLAGVW